MISYGWTWKGVYSYHVTMAWWVAIVLFALVVFFSLLFIFTSRRH